MKNKWKVLAVATWAAIVIIGVMSFTSEKKIMPSGSYIIDQRSGQYTLYKVQDSGTDIYVACGPGGTVSVAVH